MPQILFATDTTPNLGDLDANFTELYALLARIFPSGTDLRLVTSLIVGAGGVLIYEGAANVLSLRAGASGGYSYVNLTSHGGTYPLLESPSGVLALGVSNTPKVLIETAIMRPAADNAFAAGSGAYRFSTLYAGTGTINTSDAREKTAVRAMSSAELAAAKALAAEIGAFKFLAAVAEKGEPAARTHIGMTVQRAIEVMEANGLDPMAYGFICHDEWGADEETGQQAGDRYSFRPDELLLFVARGFEARLAALEAAAA